MKTLLLSFLLLSTFMAFGQTAPGIEWQKTYGGSNDESINAIVPTLDGGYIMAGYSKSANGNVTGNKGKSDCWIVKLDNNGAIQWQKTFGGSDEDGANSIQQATDGGYIVAGYSASADGDVTGNHNPPYTDFWVLKLAADGQLQWQKSLGGSRHDRANAVQLTTDGGYIIAGFTYSYDGDVTTNIGLSDYWVVKLDSAGVIQWQKSLGVDSYDNATSVQATPDGGYIVAGSSETEDEIDGPDFLIIKLDSAGNTIWQSRPGGAEIDFPFAMQVTADGGCIAVGWTSSNINGEWDENGNMYIVKLGSIGWQETLGGIGYDYAHSVQLTPDGGYIIAGASQSKDLPGYHGGNDYWVVKLNSNGTVIWEKMLGGSGVELANSIAVTPDGGYIVAGDANSNNGDVSGNRGGYDGWVVKLLPDGVLPVTLTSFAAQKQHTDVLLQWQTATEINSKQFNIQRSSDGERFTTIGVTPAAGNSTTIKAYNYVDVTALLQPGTLYYRLEQVDKDGSKYYSKVAVIKNLPANVFTIMPNPVKSTITVQSKINATHATVQLSDMNGKVIYSSSKSITAGYFDIGAANLAAGTYNLTICANGDKYVLRVVKE